VNLKPFVLIADVPEWHSLRLPVTRTSIACLRQQSDTVLKIY
jgi:hypothetical protein